MATKKKACPKCGIVGSIDKLFGYRKLRWDVIVPQSWCTQCRTNKGCPPKPKVHIITKDEVATLYSINFTNDKTRRGYPDRLRRLQKHGLVSSNLVLE